MPKHILFILLVINQFFGFGQSLTDSIQGKYVYTNWIGGGFAGDGNGNCYAVPPDAEIEHTLLIDSALNIIKVVDTTGSMTGVSNFLFDCDTLYTGKVAIINDTLIATFNKKTICPFFYIKLFDQEEEEDVNTLKYEDLLIPVIEKYFIRRIEGKLFSITIVDETIDWPEEYRKADPSEL